MGSRIALNFLTAVVLMAGCRLVVAQPSSEPISGKLVSRPSVSVRFLWNGQAKVHFQSRSAYFLKNLDLLELLQSTEVLKEIEASDSQKEKLEQLLQQWRKQFNQALEESEIAGRRFLELKDAQKCEKTIDKMLELLLEPQKKRLKEIVVRGMIRRGGVIYGLLPLAKTDLELSRKQVITIAKSAEKLKQEILPPATQAVQQSSDRLFKNLSSKQYKTLKEFFGSEFALYPNPDLYLYQLHRTLQFKESKEQSDRVLKYRGFLAQELYFLDSSGQLKQEYEKVRERELGNALMQHVQKEDFHALVRLTDSQIAALLKLKEDQRNKQKDWERQMDREVFNTSLSTAEKNRLLRSKFRPLRSKFLAEIVPTIEKILVPGQLEHLEKLAITNECFYDGLGFSLAYGALGKRLLVTTGQKKQILKTVASEYKTLFSELQKLEKKTYDSVFKLLEKNQQKKIRELVGDRPKFIRPAPYLQLLSLTSLRN